MIVCLVAAVALLLARIRLRFGRFAAPALVALALLTLLAAPTTWAAVSVQGGNGGAWLPEVGPANSMGGVRSGTFMSGAQAVPNAGSQTGDALAQPGRVALSRGRRADSSQVAIASAVAARR